MGLRGVGGEYLSKTRQRNTIFASMKFFLGVIVYHGGTMRLQGQLFLSGINQDRIKKRKHMELFSFQGVRVIILEEIHINRKIISSYWDLQSANEPSLLNLKIWDLWMGGRRLPWACEALTSVCGRSWRVSAVNPQYHTTVGYTYKKQ